MDGFLEASWAWFPGWSALGRGQRAVRGWEKTADSHVDSYFRFQTRFFAILERFWEVFGDQNGSKNRFLAGFSENVDFLKIVVFPEENCYF